MTWSYGEHMESMPVDLMIRQNKMDNIWMTQRVAWFSPSLKVDWTGQSQW